MQYQKPVYPIMISLVAVPLDVAFLALFSDLSQGGWRYEGTRRARRRTP